MWRSQRCCHHPNTKTIQLRCTQDVISNLTVGVHVSIDNQKWIDDGRMERKLTHATSWIVSPVIFFLSPCSWASIIKCWQNNWSRRCRTHRNHSDVITMNNLCVCGGCGCGWKEGWLNLAIHQRGNTIRCLSLTLWINAERLFSVFLDARTIVSVSESAE